MRVSLYDLYNTMHTIDSSDLEIISKWLGAWTPIILADSPNHFRWQIEVWPSNDTEQHWIQDILAKKEINPYSRHFLDARKVRHLAEAFNELADGIEKRDRRINI